MSCAPLLPSPATIFSSRKRTQICVPKVSQRRPNVGAAFLSAHGSSPTWTADPETRAYRRLNEMKENGKDVSYDEVLENVLERDRIDSERAVAPLRQAEDAVVVDNSDLTVEEQFNFLVSLARTRMEDDA